MPVYTFKMTKDEVVYSECEVTVTADTLSDARYAAHSACREESAKWKEIETDIRDVESELNTIDGVEPTYDDLGIVLLSGKDRVDDHGRSISTNMNPQEESYTHSNY